MVFPASHKIFHSSDTARVPGRKCSGGGGDGDGGGGGGGGCWGRGLIQHLII